MVLLQLSVLLMLASTHSHPHKRQADDMDHGDMNMAGEEECCDQKMVGEDRYFNIGYDHNGMTFDLNCLSPCIFEKEDQPGSKYCFAAGDMKVECEDDMDYTPTNRPRPTGEMTEGPDGETDGMTDDGMTEDPNGVTGDTTTTEADDEVVTRVKGYIDAGTCDSISSSSSCGDSATSYYKEITYNGKRVVISNQVPDHDHENDQLTTNPNEACERYQFIELPLTPAKGSSATRTGLGTIGLAVTGGAFFNDWSSPQGDIALYNEGSSLDSCFGHSASGGAYHYHANINCTNAGSATGANDPDTCKLIGYYKDGVPVYGLCKDSSGMVMTSCYECTGTCTSSVTTVGGTYSGLGTVDSDYTYSDSAFSAGTCNLDSASGAIHPTTGAYSYFTTVDYPWVPIYFYGDQGTSSFCSAN